MGRADWVDHFPSEVTCLRCLRPTAGDDLDRLLWCEECVGRARRRAALRGILFAAGFVLLLGAYILLVVRPDFSIIPMAWVLVLVVAFYLSARLGREFAYGVDRLTNRPAADARAGVASKDEG